jgi:hypothetical protein
MDNNDFQQEIFKEITRRTAAKIMAAHQRGDDLRKAVEFQQKEIRDGADLMQAITTTSEVFPDLELQEELTVIMEAVGEKK